MPPRPPQPAPLALLDRIATPYNLGVRLAARGRYAITAGFPGVYLWDLDAKKKVRTYRRNSGYVCWLAAITPDQRRVLAGFGDCTLRLFDFGTGKPIHLWRLDQIVTSLDIAADSRHALTGTPKFAQLWDLAQGQEILRLAPRKSATWKVAIAPDVRLGATGGNDKLIHLWDLRTGKELAALAGHDKRITGLAFSADGRVLASASNDRTARLWDVARGVELRVLRGHAKPINAVALSPDASKVLTGSNDRTVRLWDAATGLERARGIEHTRPVLDVTISPDGAIAASTSNALLTWRLS